MGQQNLFGEIEASVINATAAKSKAALRPVSGRKSITSTRYELDKSTNAVLEYFKDSPAVLITDKNELRKYVMEAVASGYCGIDTETTGLDRIHDTVVGCSLYYPGGVECYIPTNHIVPYVEKPYDNQLSYQDVAECLQLFVDNNCKMIFANADYDLAMIYKDYGVDMISVCYYDVILAWRCLKENEQGNGLKQLYTKYPLKGKGDPKKFSDFFSPALFPYSKPEVAKLYAANDAKITYELFMWQLPYVTKGNIKCTRNNLEKLADLIWNIEFPMIRVCALMHRQGVYFDHSISETLATRYQKKYQAEVDKLASLVQEIIDATDDATVKYNSPFKSGKEFNESSSSQVVYLLNKFLGYDVSSADKAQLKLLNIPVTKQILVVREFFKLINTYIDKLPLAVGTDGRIHSTFKSIGADTGRMSSNAPNLQQVPSHAPDIRHELRATPAEVVVSDCTLTEGANTYTVDLFNYDTVTVDGESIKVHRLKLGDIVELIIDEVSVFGEIITLTKNETTPYTKIEIMIDTVLGNKVKIRHITPPYVMMSSDYSQQEPKMLAFLSQDEHMLDAFMNNKDIYATMAALAYHVPYEQCLENNPVTGELQPEGKQRRSSAKVLVLGITYGMSTTTMGDMLFGKDKTLSEDERTAKVQEIYDSLLKAFPGINRIMKQSQEFARTYGYVETILGRRRHIPDMQLPLYEFKPTKGYVNPDIDPMDIKTLNNPNEIPKRITDKLYKELTSYKYPGQVYKRISKLRDEEHIAVVRHEADIIKASRKCLNSRVQGSAAELTKIAMLKVFNNPEWNMLGARVILPVHDELIAEVPIDNYERASYLLGHLMSEAGNFLPFEIKCDVATSLRWYGLEFPCTHTQPTVFHLTSDGSDLSDSEIRWIQYYLCEAEYILPVFPKPDGGKPEGEEARGVNGIWSEVMHDSIKDYMTKYQITDDEFITHIYNKVVYNMQL